MGSQLDQPLLTTSSTSAVPSFSGSGPRILDRDGEFSQSRGRWKVSTVNSQSRTSSASRSMRQRNSGSVSNVLPINGNRATPITTVPRRTSAPTPTFWETLFYSSICRSETENEPRLTLRRCWDDWFHTLSNTPTCILMFGIFVAYFVTIVIFAGLYLTVNKVGSTDNVSVESRFSEASTFCGMDINNHMEALYFSLSTMATIGYGTSDYYFGDCWTPFIIVLLQVFSAIVFSSLAVGLLFQRMSRGQKRGRTIVFSDVAIIRRIGGRWYFMLRVAELRKRHVIGAKVRLFCVKHERCPITNPGAGEIVDIETAYFVSHPMSLLNGSSAPDKVLEEGRYSSVTYEQNILMGLPNVLVHRMDSTSPMSPPSSLWYDENGIAHSGTSTINPDGNSLAEQDTAPSDSHVEETHTFYQGSPSAEEITYFLHDRQAEIIVLVEGTCEVTGMAVQARHSYRLEDIAFNRTFAPCVFPTESSTPMRRVRWNLCAKKRARVDANTSSSGDEEYNQCHNSTLEVDFCQFHQLIAVPYDSMSCPYVPSSSVD